MPHLDDGCRLDTDDVLCRTTTVIAPTADGTRVRHRLPAHGPTGQHEARSRSMGIGDKVIRSVVPRALLVTRAVFGLMLDCLPPWLILVSPCEEAGSTQRAFECHAWCRRTHAIIVTRHQAHGSLEPLAASGVLDCRPRYRWTESAICMALNICR
ncbi:hypothetical protein CONLIGDRAFT_627441 [Coniochaeta ligniaria NRRL 30616]|uniref:Uncharacterized protein n=1 Tax=Coniochaeta ligniaria NRRL 30616 TaxID=1408157 RepID=A0A1J7J7G1_9PEZI|nr:hypothetical protein CONLIGDRAFT_627441 [Coniochaeta ligniaria NRRL 30616]